MSAKKKPQPQPKGKQKSTSDKKPGRQPIITPKVEHIILEGISNGNTMTYMCNLLDITRMTEWNYRQTHPEYARRLSEALERRVEVVEDALFAKAVSGDVVAQKFFLTNRSGKQWRNIQEHQVGGVEEGHPIRVGVKEIVVEIPSGVQQDESKQTDTTQEDE
ncbi:MAG TPA: hypothetical protein PKC99_05965 [Anaerolineales bacterium]|nr:hypothetical protein [Anaerolineales bacterium]